jgi:hypothetical protein
MHPLNSPNRRRRSPFRTHLALSPMPIRNLLWARGVGRYSVNATRSGNSARKLEISQNNQALAAYLRHYHYKNRGGLFLTVSSLAFQACCLNSRDINREPRNNIVLHSMERRGHGKQNVFDAWLKQYVVRVGSDCVFLLIFIVANIVRHVRLYFCAVVRSRARCNTARNRKQLHAFVIVFDSRIFSCVRASEYED